MKGIVVFVLCCAAAAPGAVFAKTFALEYGRDTIEIHRADLETKRNILLIDDLVATGGTLKAAADILREAGSRPVGVLAVVGLPFLHYDRVLGGLPVQTLIDYHGE